MARRPSRSFVPPPGLAPDVAAVGSSVVAFLVAGVLFMASVVAVLVATNSAGGDGSADASDAAAMRVQARDLASTVLTSPGFATAGGDWADGANTYTGRTMNAEGLQRLGLLDDQATEQNMLEYAKFQNLRRAKYAADAANGHVDYQEAVASLGLDAAGLDFHVRAYPSLQSVIELLASGARDDNLRVAYVGNIEVEEVTAGNQTVALTTGLTYTTPVCTVDNALHPRMYRISTTVHNGGSTPTQFTAVTTADLGVAPQVQNTNGYLVPAGGDVTLYADVAYLPGRSCGEGTSIAFDLYDPVHARLLTIAHTFTAAEGAATGAPAATTARGLYVDTGSQYYLPGQRVVLSYGGNNLANNDKLYLRVCPGTAECDNAGAVYMKDADGTVFSAGNTNNNGRTVDVGTLPAGEYTAWLYDLCQSASCNINNNDPAAPAAGHVRATERILVSAAAVGGYTPVGQVIQETRYTASGPGALEVSFLERLVSQFCPSFFDTATKSPLSPWAQAQHDARCAFKAGQPTPIGGAQPGDVFPDTKKVMNNDLPARLLHADGTPNFDITNVLVVGSGVDQNAMTSQSAKGTIRDWVVGGGTLIVFGSDEGNVNWLEPLFHSAIRSGSGGISVPDISHPILHTPDELDDPAHNYDARGQAWRFNGQTAQIQANEATALFTNVIVEGNAQTGNPLLADSKPGAIGNGSIILTSYLPHDLYGNGPASANKDQPSTGPDSCPGYTVSECEALKFVHNLLMSGYGDLYLDYGPECPLETNCIPDVRTAQIRHPEFTDPIQLRLNVFVFPS